MKRLLTTYIYLFFACTIAMAQANGHRGVISDNIEKTLREQREISLREQKEHEAKLLQDAYALKVLAVKSALKDGVNVDARDRYGETPLMKMIDFDTNKSLHHDPIYVRVKQGDILSALLSKKADVNAQSYSGTTALMLAAEKGNAWMIRRLIRAGAKPGITDKNGNTVFHYTTNEVFILPRELLALHRLADHDPAAVFKINDQGYTPLAAAIEGSNLMQVKFFLKIYKKAGRRINDCPKYKEAYAKTKEIADVLGEFSDKKIIQLLDKYDTLTEEDLELPEETELQEDDA